MVGWTTMLLGTSPSRVPSIRVHTYPASQFTLLLGWHKMNHARPVDLPKAYIVRLVL
jgi:hypothetical protein